MKQSGDQYLIDALISNDNQGINTIYERFSAKIERFVCANSGTSDDARDVFQEALIAIARQARKSGFTLTCPFEGYLFVVCRGKWLNELRRRKRQEVTIEGSAGFTETDEAWTLGEQTLHDEAREALFREFLEKLPASCLQILRLAWSGLSMEEVGVQLNMSYNYVRKRKSECISRLAASIQAAPAYQSLKYTL
ncbi:sigma-70 family RNA polymerase sigma factor [Runella sp.]|uniref:RNA polymerase sigma factor n=1 Tax=Runella sp. TaxID=1960881 RepID=UPI003017C72F